MNYDADYFNWQKNVGAFGGMANLFKFVAFIRPTDTVLDFGCGGGYLLHHITCQAKAGIEISATARAEAQRLGLTVYEFPKDVPDDFATVIVSNHALEHVECPLDILRALRPKLKPGGKAVFVVPHQGPDESYRPGDINQHLYTWNPLTLGNLFYAAGYTNIHADAIRHKWPPNYTRWYVRLGPRGFDRLARLYARYKHNYQIRVVAERAQA